MRSEEAPGDANAVGGHGWYGDRLSHGSGESDGTSGEAGVALTAGTAATDAHPPRRSRLLSGMTSTCACTLRGMHETTVSSCVYRSANRCFQSYIRWFGKVTDYFMTWCLRGTPGVSILPIGVSTTSFQHLVYLLTSDKSDYYINHLPASSYLSKLSEST